MKREKIQIDRVKNWANKIKIIRKNQNPGEKHNLMTSRKCEIV